MIKKLVMLGLLSCAGQRMHAVTATGDTTGGSTTFQFSVGNAVYDGANTQLWTTAGTTTSSLSATVQSYGVAYTPFIPIDGSLGTALVAYPYLPSQAFVSSTDSVGVVTLPTTVVANPLLGLAFSAVTFVGTYITLVNAAAPQYVYFVQSSMFSDGAYGKNSPDGLAIVNQLDLGTGNQAKAIAGSGLGTLFIAQAQGTFGTASSEISFAATSTSSSIIINGQNTTLTTLSNQASVPVSLTTSVLTASGASLASMGSLVNFYPSPITALQMYVGFDVTASAVAGNAAVGMCCATATQAVDGGAPASIALSSVISDAVARAGLRTPVSTIAGESIGVANITTQVTSTGLSYLINSRHSAAGLQYVYATPMVTVATDSSQNGMIADFDSVVTTFKIIGTTFRTQGFSEVLTNAAQIDINSGVAEIVNRMKIGAGPVPLAAGQFIEQLVAQGDAVYITIKDAFATGCKPGMFKSQALFDASGRIMLWSPWQRVAGTDDQMLFAIKNRTTDATMYVSGASSDTIQQTVWSATADLQAFISKTSGVLPAASGGVQGVFPFPATTSGFTASGTSSVTMLVATGNENVLVAQTGQLVGDAIQIVPQTTSTSIVLNSDFGLNIGSVVSAAFGTDNSGENWLFMAGDGGLSVLSKANGSGFETLPNSGAAASLIATDQTCKTIGTFSFVKKIVFDGAYLYVMTQNSVYRFLPLTTAFTAVAPAPLYGLTEVVTATDLAANAYCTDMLVDHDRILLGTTAGLYLINVSGGIPGVVSQIEIPGGLPTVSRMQAVSGDVDFYNKFYTSSNLYVLTINFSVQQARLNRFTIREGVVTPIEDQLLPGINAPLLIFDYMNNNLFIDGSLGFTTSYRIGSLPPAALYMEYTLQAGRSSSQSLIRAQTANLPIVSILNSLGLTGITRDYASGCLVLAADFGLLADS